MENQRMFFDDVQAKYLRLRERILRAKTLNPRAVQYIERDVQLWRASKIFLLNGAVVDDLYRFPHDDTDYQATINLPFPVIFFELMNPLDLQVGDETKSLKAMRYGHGRDMDITRIRDNIQEDEFQISLFYTDSLDVDDDVPKIDAVSFSLSTLPRFDFRISRSACDYTYDPQNGLAIRRYEDDPTISSMIRTQVESGRFRDVKDPDRYVGNFARLLDLCVNVVHYINAHNVTIRKTKRETRTQEEIERINRKRLRDGKREIMPLKPYYWINVKQSVVDEKEGQNQSTMEYREWVRGHLQRYHTDKGLVRKWVQPYIRGPPDKPWKENRYRVLADMLSKGPRFA